MKPDNKVYWEKPWQSDGEEGDGEDDLYGSQKKSVTKFVKRSLGGKISSSPILRRSLSFSSISCFSSLGDDKGSPSYPENAYNHASEFSTQSQYFIPERSVNSERRGLSTVQGNALVNTDTHMTYNEQKDTLSKSPSVSSATLKCRVSRISQQVSDQNKNLDLCSDEECPQKKSNDQRIPSSISKGGCLVENKTIVNSRRPPRAHSTAPSSPNYCKENHRSQNYINEMDTSHFLSLRDKGSGDSRYGFSPNPRKKHVQKLSYAHGEKSKTKFRDYYSETSTTTEDIYEEDTSQLRQVLLSDADVFNGSYSNYPSPCKIVKSCFSQNSFDPMGYSWNVKSEEEIDNELNIKLKEAEVRFLVMSEIDTESKKLESSSLSKSALLQMIGDINKDRQNLALEILTHVQDRISERCSAREKLKKVRVDFDTRIKRIEKENSKLQSNLEKELDRRSCDWSSNLEKIQAEEFRLREQVRELAEQNGSLQREVSTLSGREQEKQSRIMNLEVQLNDLTERWEFVNVENLSLQKNISELRQYVDSVKDDKDFMERSYRDKEKENMDLHRIISKFHRTCSEHEKTIAGLRQGYGNMITNESLEKRDPLSTRLQLEQVRLTGVEQTLRKEIESYRQETEYLRHENTCLLDRLQNDSDGYRFSFRLEHEIHARLELLKNQGLSLLYENNEYCCKLIDILKEQELTYHQDNDAEFDCYYVAEYNSKFLGLSRAIANFKKSLQTLSEVVDEKTNLDVMTYPSENGHLKQLENKTFQDDIELELKAETLLTAVLRENLLSKELEFDRLQEDLTCSIRSREKLEFKIQRLQDHLSNLNHKVKDLELQMLIKNENLNQLKHEYEECAMELGVSRDTLPLLSKDRDSLREEVKKLEVMDTRLNDEVCCLKKKIETLEEDILIKEGQISILKDGLQNKSFHILGLLD
ncbi:hypothetical protein ZOSMA_8G01710 [Zostera marina]|uniref:DUF7653 domain-containing protein n=1 Tax=Zostera marina TaxID=29655 RepID=A0A0K9NLQ0_ZOSMR|nr:hypothetical protein ZOSMA_8G01710 [Zostera marina]